ncbi:6-phosphofructokinase [Zooshikella sp. RANM57]|uniref:6-phosphofructokinase n=1 Tax=Zooshikella sp. RANM57 TaxID=3425863 RepID=UPI003D6E7819
MTKHIGILTSGGDCPGLNAAIRGVVKAGQYGYGMEFIGFKDGFRGIALDRSMELNDQVLSGILTDGGTILGTSRDKPHKMPIGNKVIDMTETIVENYHRNHLDGLVCIGGGGTQKNALRLKEAGLNVITLPKTIDNDVAITDVTFGFDTALGIATQAIDRLHTTATSHHRVIVVEIMGHNAGWLALGAGIAGGADVILLPELPYRLETVAEAIKHRVRSNKRFSIIAYAEGALTVEEAQRLTALEQQRSTVKDKAERKALKLQIKAIANQHADHSVWLTEQVEKLTGQESRLTILGHLQRGGTPSAGDRLLATHLGATAAQLIHQNQFGVMVAVNGQSLIPVPLEEVVLDKKRVPENHPWVQTAKEIGICLGI